MTSEKIYRIMRQYSPVDNVVEGTAYPAVLATAGLHDRRVNYWEPAKWVQLLRRASTSGRPVLWWTDTEADQSGPSGRYEGWKHEARILGFIVRAIDGL